jgi:hypothetical protein
VIVRKLLMLWMLFWLWHIATVYGFSSVLMGNLIYCENIHVWLIVVLN